MKVWSKIFTVLIMLFLFAPILILLVFSFNGSNSLSVFSEPSLFWYRELFKDSETLGSLRNTLILALSASVISTVLGTAAAVGINSLRNKFLKTAIDTTTNIPMVNPDIITGISLMCRLWPNYSTDYEPLVEFANEHKLRVFATNVPRRYANSVKNNGCNILDSLSEEARRYLPPLPLKLKENEQTKEAFGMMSMMRKNAHPEFMAQSQALKDATMAWNISKHQDFLMVHFNGNYHTDGGDGIINYLKGYWKGVKFKSICSVRQEDISHLDECNIGRADFYICVPEDMVTTY